MVTVCHLEQEHESSCDYLTCTVRIKEWCILSNMSNLCSDHLSVALWFLTEMKHAPFHWHHIILPSCQSAVQSAAEASPIVGAAVQSADSVSSAHHRVTPDWTVHLWRRRDLKSSNPKQSVFLIIIKHLAASPQLSVCKLTWVNRKRFCFGSADLFLEHLKNSSLSKEEYLFIIIFLCQPKNLFSHKCSHRQIDNFFSLLF